MTDYLLVVTSLPDMASSRTIARELLKARLAACISIQPSCVSLYWWKDEICESSECILLIKTRTALYSRVEAFLRENHPYELPEIIATTMNHGSSSYLGWIQESTQE